jgi:hypothetical protein
MIESTDEMILKEDRSRQCDVRLVEVTVLCTWPFPRPIKPSLSPLGVKKTSRALGRGPDAFLRRAGLPLSARAVIHSDDASRGISCQPPNYRFGQLILEPASDEMILKEDWSRQCDVRLVEVTVLCTWPFPRPIKPSLSPLGVKKMTTTTMGNSAMSAAIQNTILANDW